MSFEKVQVKHEKKIKSQVKPTQVTKSRVKPITKTSIKKPKKIQSNADLKKLLKTVIFDKNKSMAKPKKWVRL